jgi:hypothetical protein
VSDIPHDLDLREQIARIDRNQAETQKLLAESHKFRRERWVIPVTVAGALLAAAVARLDVIARIFGWLS